MKFYIAEKDFRAFCSCDLDLDPMTFIYELDAYHLKLYPQTNNERSRKLSYYVQRDIRTYNATDTVATPLACGKNVNDLNIYF